MPKTKVEILKWLLEGYINRLDDDTAKEAMATIDKLGETAKEEVWDLLDRVTDYPGFDCITRDTTESFVWYFPLDKVNKECVRAPTLREAILEAAVALNIEIEIKYGHKENVDGD